MPELFASIDFVSGNGEEFLGRNSIYRAMHGIH
jgi:hypothetical protein